MVTSTQKRQVQDTIGTGRYVFPELPAGHYWSFGPAGGFAFATLYIMKKRKGWFDKVVRHARLVHFYTEVDGTLHPYEPGKYIHSKAVTLRFAAFPHEYKDESEASFYYLPEFTKSAGAEGLLEPVYHSNFGNHQPGADIKHYVN